MPGHPRIRASRRFLAAIDVAARHGAGPLCSPSSPRTRSSESTQHHVEVRVDVLILVRDPKTVLVVAKTAVRAEHASGWSGR